MPETTLIEFVKGLLGFYGSGGDTTLVPLILASQQTLTNGGVNEPDGEDEKVTSLYNTAVALQVKILSDGDEKGHWQRALTGIILQIKDYSGGETA